MAPRIVISAGHSKYVSGANGYIQEFEETSRVTERVAEILEGMGALAGVFIDETSRTQNENLNAIVNYHNSKTRDWDVSIHFNSNGNTSGPLGCEVLYVSSTGQTMADKLVDNICVESGLNNRGPKKRTDLFFLNNTEMPAVLVEVCFVTSKADTDIYRSRFEDICHAIASTLTGQEVEPVPPEPEPPEPPEPDEGQPTIKKGSTGPAVSSLQKSLGCLIPDGDFGSITDTWVRAFQGASGLTADGIVGPMTWDEVDDLDSRVKHGGPPLPPALVDQIVTIAKNSEIQDFLWPDRGMTPPGYIPGMALCFAYALRQFNEGDDAAVVMAKAQGNPDKDALAWYESEFRALGMNNRTAGVDTLRHLFVMAIGLGPRESSGRYCEGRDLSSSNVQSDTAEAGLMQTSWNLRSASSTIPPLLPHFWNNPNGFREVFKENVDATANNLNSYGSGDGIRYQWLSRFAPLFHCCVTAVGLRTLRAHWGPVSRKEVLLKREADDLLKAVQELVESVS